jgi:hypothetical protein
MKETNDLSAFKAINEEIKTALRSLDEKLSDYPYFHFEKAQANNDSFLHLLDQLLDARCKIETLKQFNSSGEDSVSE